MPRYRQGSISWFASLPARWDQDSRMPQNMEIKIVWWSGNSIYEGLNLGAGMQQQFRGNRRRRSGQDRGFRGACWFRRKQFRKICGANSLALAVAWERGLHRLQLFSPSHIRVNESFCSTLLNTTKVESLWPSVMCGCDSGQQLARRALCLFQRKHRLLDWSTGRSGMEGFACISWDPCLGHCHCQSCMGL